MAADAGEGRPAATRAALPLAIAAGAPPLSGDRVDADRCGASNQLAGDRRCSRRSSVRVTGTQRATVDLCAQHARMAADRPRLVREWLLRPGLLRAEARPMDVATGARLPLAGHPDALLLVAADLGSLAVIRAGVARALTRNGWAEERHVVLLAVNEAAANAIEHGSGAGSRVEVAVTVDPQRVRVRVADGGRLGAAMPLDAPVAPPSDRVRGRGLRIMHALCARIRVHTDGDGTVVLLEFVALGTATG